MDSRANDYMTNSSKLFNTDASYPNNTKIVSVNGSLTIIAGIGTININSYLTLTDVLHIPTLSTHFISVTNYLMILIA